MLIEELRKESPVLLIGVIHLCCRPSDAPKLPLVTTGGVVDPSSGEARVFKTTVLDEEDRNPSPGFTRKHVQTIVEQSAVLGDLDAMETQAMPSTRLLSGSTPSKGAQRKPWEDQPENPLYSSQVRVKTVFLKRLLFLHHSLSSRGLLLGNVRLHFNGVALKCWIIARSSCLSFCLQEYISDFNNPLFEAPTTDFGATTTDDDGGDFMQAHRLSLQDDDDDQAAHGEAFTRTRGLRSGGLSTSSKKETQMSDDFLQYLAADPSGPDVDGAYGSDQQHLID